jgi:tripeptidyl-peptidase I
LITSGGGFSLTYSQPSWQKTVVSNYFKKVDNTVLEPYQEQGGIEVYIDDDYGGTSLALFPYYFVNSNRGYPDVSLFGHNYLVVYNTSLHSVDGTSASAPTFAGMVTLLNYNRLQAGQSKMGFMNPFLYSYANDFVHDILSGNNSCTAIYNATYSPSHSATYIATCCAEGFSATNGWDPATGLGSVDYDKMLVAALKAGTSSGDSNNDSLSTGAIVGIAIGAAVVVGLIFAGLAYAFGWFCFAGKSGALLENQV